MDTPTEELRAAVEVYFDARNQMFGNVPEFRVFRAGPLRGFHRHPRWPEQDAFYALGVGPHAAVAAVRAYRPHPHHVITVFADSAEPFRAAFAGLGYKALGGPGQPFLQRRLCGPPDSKDVQDEGQVSEVRRAGTPADLSFVNSAGEGMVPTHLEGRPLRHYFIERAGRPACVGRCVMTGIGAIYVTDVDTAPEYRRQGLATALLGRMHRDAAAEGATASVLCSTPMGLSLYRAAGYEVLTHMHSFIPHGWTL